MGNDLVHGWTDLKDGKNGRPDKWSYYIEMKGLDPEKTYNISIYEQGQKQVVDENPLRFG